MNKNNGILDHAQFASTGADWLVESPQYLTLALGPRWKDATNIIPEAQWFSDQYTATKRRWGTGPWQTTVDLGRLPQWRFAPLAMARIYARMVQDSATEHVAFIRATGWQRQFIQMFLWTMVNAKKIRFFETLDEAEAWLGKPRSEAVRLLLSLPAPATV